MGAFVLYYLFWLLVAAGSGQWVLLPLTVLLGIAGYFGMLHREQGQRLNVLRRKQALDPSTTHHLLALRQKVVQTF